MDDITLLSYSGSSKDEQIRRMMDEVDPLDCRTEIVYSSSDLTEYRTSRDALISIRELYKEFNEKYGLELRFDGDNIIQQFGNILEPNKLKVFEIYLSEAYSRVRVILYQRIMIHIITLLDEITSPKNNEDVSVQDKYVMTEKLLEFMSTINKIYEEIKIPNSEIELKRLRDEEKDDSQDINYNDPDIQMALNKLKSSTLKPSEDN